MPSRARWFRGWRRWAARGAHAPPEGLAKQRDGGGASTAATHCARAPASGITGAGVCAAGGGLPTAMAQVGALLAREAKAARPHAMEGSAAVVGSGEFVATRALGRNGAFVRAGDPLCDCSFSLARFSVVPAWSD